MPNKLNYEHIDALLKFSDTRVRREADGLRLVSQGHFLIDYAGAMDTSEFKTLEYCLALWIRAEKDPAAREPNGRMAQLHCSKTGETTTYYRRVGTVLIQEAFIRCFPAGSTFHIPKHPSPAIVLFEGRQVGLIMPIMETEGTRYPFAAEPISDEDVFKPFASERNGWYLCAKQGLAIKRNDLVSQLNEAKQEMRDARDRIEELTPEIESLEKRIEAMDAH